MNTESNSCFILSAKLLFAYIAYLILILNHTPLNFIIFGVFFIVLTILNIIVNKNIKWYNVFWNVFILFVFAFLLYYSIPLFILFVLLSVSFAFYTGK